MKKFITNKILKKFIWTSLLIIILFQVWFPTLAMAAIKEGTDKKGNKYYNYTKEYVSDLYTNWIKILPQKHIDGVDEDDKTFYEKVIGSIMETYGVTETDAETIFDNRTAKEKLVVMAIENGNGEMQIGCVWDCAEEYLAEGIAWDTAYVKKRHVVLGLGLFRT